MFSLEFYRWLHVVSLLFVLTGLAGAWGLRAVAVEPTRRLDKALANIHGFGMVGILVAGFGAMARLGYMAEWPWWIYLKLVIWLLLGGSMTLAKRRANWGPWLILAWISIAALGAYLGISKPATF